MQNNRTNLAIYIIILALFVVFISTRLIRIQYENEQRLAEIDMLMDHMIELENRIEKLEME